MDNFHFIDIYATKGIEYLLVIAFLVLLVFGWRYLNQPRSERGRIRG